MALAIVFGITFLISRNANAFFPVSRDIMTGIRLIRNLTRTRTRNFARNLTDHFNDLFKFHGLSILTIELERAFKASCK